MTETGSMAQRHTIQAVVYPGDESGYVALQLHLEGEDLAEMGLAANPPLLITMEMEPVHA
jgi:hypothetical protein